MTIEINENKFRKLFPEGVQIMDSLDVELNDDEALLQGFKDNLSWLESHNKNYNKQQYYLISDLKDLFSCMEIKK